MTKHIVVLGSTGSIGRQTLQVAAALGDQVEVVALGAGNNVELFLQQASHFRPAYLASPALTTDSTALASLGCQLLSMEDLAVLPEADLIVVATVGRVGIGPAVAAVRAGKTVAVANKEVLVTAGAFLTRTAQASGATIIPIDSEHSAIWQCLRGEGLPELGAPLPSVARLILTASGGPFCDLDTAALARVTPAQALHHPTWQMGPKITVDSATLMNKGLEVIEARWLFAMPYEQIDVVLHRESIVHSLVEFVDGSLKAQLGVPDMRVPIQYALTYPSRVPAPWPRLDIARVGQLSFGEVDDDKFPCLRLARFAGERGGTYPAVLSAADEVAVAAFLAGTIGFLDIPALIERVLGSHDSNPRPSLEDVLAADDWARRQCRGLMAGVR